MVTTVMILTMIMKVIIMMVLVVDNGWTCRITNALNNKKGKIPKEGEEGAFPTHLY